MLPRIKLPDLLLEVDAWTGFSRYFMHLQSGDPPKDRAALFAALLADAINLGYSRMAEACPGMTFDRLAWLADWYIRDETHTKALAEVINYHHGVPFAFHWGDGTTSSSDGQRFKVGGQSEATAQVNLRYGTEPGVTFYTHLSDQYSPYRVKRQGITINEEHLQHVSPLGWEHINLTGDYLWNFKRTPATGQLRPLRTKGK